MATISFVVFGEPTAKGRPRFFRRGNFVDTYTPKKTEIAENDFRQQALIHKPAIPWESQIELDLKIYRSIPKSMSKKNIPFAESGVIRPTTRPDLDNYIKLVCDAMNSIFWKDDSQLIAIMATKRYSQKPRIEVIIRQM